MSFSLPHKVLFKNCIMSKIRIYLLELLNTVIVFMCEHQMYLGCVYPQFVSVCLKKVFTLGPGYVGKQDEYL